MSGLTLNQKRRKDAKRDAQAQIKEMALHMAAQIPNQAFLDKCLLQEPDEDRRRTLYEFMHPVLRFDSTMPVSLEAKLDYVH